MRKGKYIFEMTKAENDKVSVNLCIETALKKIAFLAFQKASKPKRRRKIIRLTARFKPGSFKWGSQSSAPSSSSSRIR